MQPDIFQTWFIQQDCLDAIHIFGKQRSVNTQKFVFHTELKKSSLPRKDQLRFPGNCPPIPPLSHILP